MLYKKILLYTVVSLLFYLVINIPIADCQVNNAVVDMRYNLYTNNKVIVMEVTPGNQRDMSLYYAKGLVKLKQFMFFAMCRPISKKNYYPTASPTPSPPTPSPSPTPSPTIAPTTLEPTVVPPPPIPCNTSLCFADQLESVTNVFSLTITRTSVSLAGISLNCSVREIPSARMLYFTNFSSIECFAGGSRMGQSCLYFSPNPLITGPEVELYCCSNASSLPQGLSVSYTIGQNSAPSISGTLSFQCPGEEPTPPPTIQPTSSPTIVPTIAPTLPPIPEFPCNKSSCYIDKQCSICGPIYSIEVETLTCNETVTCQLRQQPSFETIATWNYTLGNHIDGTLQCGAGGEVYNDYTCIYPLGAVLPPVLELVCCSNGTHLSHETIKVTLNAYGCACESLEATFICPATEAPTIAPTIAPTLEPTTQPPLPPSTCTMRGSTFIPADSFFTMNVTTQTNDPRFSCEITVDGFGVLMSFDYSPSGQINHTFCAIRNGTIIQGLCPSSNPYFTMGENETLNLLCTSPVPVTQCNDILIDVFSNNTQQYLPIDAPCNCTEPVFDVCNTSNCYVDAECSLCGSLFSIDVSTFSIPTTIGNVSCTVRHQPSFTTLATFNYTNGLLGNSLQCNTGSRYSSFICNYDRQSVRTGVIELICCSDSIVQQEQISVDITVNMDNCPCEKIKGEFLCPVVPPTQAPTNPPTIEPTVVPPFPPSICTMQGETFVPAHTRFALNVTTRTNDPSFSCQILVEDDVLMSFNYSPNGQINNTFCAFSNTTDFQGYCPTLNTSYATNENIVISLSCNSSVLVTQCTDVIVNIPSNNTQSIPQIQGTCDCFEPIFEECNTSNCYIETECSTCGPLFSIVVDTMQLTDSTVSCMIRHQPSFTVLATFNYSNNGRLGDSLECIEGSSRYDPFICNYNRLNPRITGGVIELICCSNSTSQPESDRVQITVNMDGCPCQKITGEFLCPPPPCVESLNLTSTLLNNTCPPEINQTGIFYFVNEACNNGTCILQGNFSSAIVALTRVNLTVNSIEFFAPGWICTGSSCVFVNETLLPGECLPNVTVAVNYTCTGSNCGDIIVLRGLLLGTSVLSNPTTIVVDCDFPPPFPTPECGENCLIDENFVFILPLVPGFDMYSVIIYTAINDPSVICRLSNQFQESYLFTYSPLGLISENTFLFNKSQTSLTNLILQCCSNTTNSSSVQNISLQAFYAGQQSQVFTAEFDCPSINLESVLLNNTCPTQNETGVFYFNNTLCNDGPNTLTGNFSSSFSSVNENFTATGIAFFTEGWVCAQTCTFFNATLLPGQCLPSVLIRVNYTCNGTSCYDNITLQAFFENENTSLSSNTQQIYINCTTPVPPIPIIECQSGNCFIDANFTIDLSLPILPNYSIVVNTTFNDPSVVCQLYSITSDQRYQFDYSNGGLISDNQFIFDVNGRRFQFLNLLCCSNTSNSSLLEDIGIQIFYGGESSDVFPIEFQCPSINISSVVVENIPPPQLNESGTFTINVTVCNNGSSILDGNFTIVINGSSSNLTVNNITFSTNGWVCSMGVCTFENTSLSLGECLPSLIITVNYTCNSTTCSHTDIFQAFFNNENISLSSNVVETSINSTIPAPPPPSLTCNEDYCMINEEHDVVAFVDTNTQFIIISQTNDPSVTCNLTFINFDQSLLFNYSNGGVINNPTFMLNNPVQQGGIYKFNLLCCSDQTNSSMLNNITITFSFGTTATAVKTFNFECPSIILTSLLVNNTCPVEVNATGTFFFNNTLCNTGPNTLTGNFSSIFSAVNSNLTATSITFFTDDWVCAFTCSLTNYTLEPGQCLPPVLIQVNYTCNGTSCSDNVTLQAFFTNGNLTLSSNTEEISINCTIPGPPQPLFACSSCPTNYDNVANFAVVSYDDQILDNNAVIFGDIGTYNGTITIGGTINGDVYTFNGTVTLTGSGTVNGNIYYNSLQGLTAINAANLIYEDALNCPCTRQVTESDFQGNVTFTPGVYCANEDIVVQSTSAIRLDAQGNSSAIFVFKINGSIDFIGNADVFGSGGTRPCNVFWIISGTTDSTGSNTLIGNFIVKKGALQPLGANIHGRYFVLDVGIQLAGTPVITTCDCDDGNGISIDS